MQHTEQEAAAFSFFLPQQALVSLEPLGSGLVNDTWLAAAQSGSKYVLQRLNTAVFPNPALVQANLCQVTEYVQARLAPDQGFTVFRLIRSPKGESSFVDRCGQYWRLLSYIPDSQSLHSLHSPGQACEIGGALGLFHSLLAEMPLSSLPSFLHLFSVN